MRTLEAVAHEYSSARSWIRRAGEIDPPRSVAATRALEEALAHAIGPAISIGGGPRRVDPRLRTLNVGLFGNVDVVGDAHALPFRESSVGAIHCEAVLEHLERPESAVAEMYRVLAPGACVFAATPFLQVYHGYPEHYQNFTLRGHSSLFTRAGFEVISAGPCVGPTFTLVDLLSNWAREQLPTRVVSRGVWLLFRVLGRLIVPLDRWFLRSSASHKLASSTFVLARKLP